MTDLYGMLGINKDATNKQINAAYRKVVQSYHPDNPKGGDADKFAEITRARDVLINPERRAVYDEFGAIEDGGDNNNALVLQETTKTVFDVITTLAQSGYNLLECNILEEATNALISSIEREETKLIQYDKMLQEAEHIKSHIENKTGTNVISAALETQITAIRNGKRMCQKSYQLKNKALVVLQEHSWTGPATKGRPQVDQNQFDLSQLFANSSFRG